MRRFKYNLFQVGIKWRPHVLFFWKLIIILESSVVTAIDVYNDPLVGKNTPQIIRALGYPVESHVIKTADDVLLQYFRIPHGSNSISDYGELKPVVLLVHGISSSSNQWFQQDEDKNLPLLLSEEGYDVWLANSRGVSYSNQLQSITTKNTSFWRFSFDELASFDLPAAIDYILHVTNQKQLFYIGHSQGATQVFALLSERPAYNSKIRLLVALAPAVYVNNLPEILILLGLGEFPPRLLLQFLHALAPSVCSVEPVTAVCLTLLFSAVGFDFEQSKPRKLPAVLSGFPESTSIRSFAHFFQVGTARRFQRYDYGLLRNEKIYGSPSPPAYNVSRITTPVAIFWAQNDYAVRPQNVQRLAHDLRNVVLNYRVPFDKFNHVDFTFARDAFSLVYKKVLGVMAIYR